MVDTYQNSVEQYKIYKELFYTDQHKNKIVDEFDRIISDIACHDVECKTNANKDHSEIDYYSVNYYSDFISTSFKLPEILGYFGMEHNLVDFLHAVEVSKDFYKMPSYILSYDLNKELRFKFYLSIRGDRRLAERFVKSDITMHNPDFDFNDFYFVAMNFGKESGSSIRVALRAERDVARSMVGYANRELFSSAETIFLSLDEKSNVDEIYFVFNGNLKDPSILGKEQCRLVNRMNFSGFTLGTFSVRPDGGNAYYWSPLRPRRNNAN